MSKSLKDKTVHGLGWSFIDNASNAGITFIIGLFLARILSPQEYGIMAIVTIFIAISNSIIDSGFSSALIRKEVVSEKDLNTVFLFNLLISAFLYILLFLFSPLISLFFKEPLLINVLRVMGVILIINAVAIIPRTVLVKKVDFKTQTKASLISSIISGVIGIWLAVNGLGIWALVFQQILRQVINTSILWICTNWHPIFEFSASSFNELFGFGSKMLLSGLLDTFYRNIYYFIIGRFFAPSELGYYTRAEQFSSIFSSNFTSIIQRVTYPILSSIQNDLKILKNTFEKIFRLVIFVSFPCMLGIAAIAKPLILISIGEQWRPAIPLLQIICVSGMFYPIHILNLNLLEVKGYSHLVLKLSFIIKIMSLFVIAIGLFYGLYAMLWGSNIISILACFINGRYSKKIIGYSLYHQLFDIIKILSISLIMFCGMYSLNYISISNNLLLIVCQCLLGSFIYILINLFFETKEWKIIKELYITKR